MDEQALSYAEIKALCAGNPLIAEKMGLDVEVAKLKMLKANHQSQLYRLEDNLRLNFPKQIESTKAAIDGYRADAERLELNTQRVSEGISPMTIGNSTFTERKDAGAALIDACRGIDTISTTKVGSYRGFEMSISFDTANKEYKCHLKGAMTHTVSLGSDPVGNITRIDNVFDRIPHLFADREAKLEALYSQVENAKAELVRPFPQEAELVEKSARLTELDSLLSLDGKDEPNTDAPAADGDTRNDAVVETDNTPEKLLAVKENNALLSGDESTPQIPEIPQPQYPKPAPILPQTVTQRLNEGQGAATPKAEISRTEGDSAQPPQAKPKKKSHDER
jgi:hypothetical protein